MNIPSLILLPANITYCILTPKGSYKSPASLPIQIIQFQNSANLNCIERYLCISKHNLSIFIAIVKDREGGRFMMGSTLKFDKILLNTLNVNF